MRGVHSMRTKKLPRIFIMLFCAFLFHMGSLTAYAAAESAEVRIPVSAVGADCTAALMDENGEVLPGITVEQQTPKFYVDTKEDK